MRANKLLLLTTSLVTLVLLVYAAYSETVARDWRRLQRSYRTRLPADEAAAFDVQLRQLYVPALGATDRCISCHVGMAPGERGIDGDPVFRRHPDVVHDPADFGCVVCHGGQGPATETADAHGAVHFWPDPMLPQRYAYAGCGGCHTHLAVPNLDELARGERVLERSDCLACHALDGRGGTLRPGAEAVAPAPDLSRVGATGFDPRWYDKHLAERAAATGGPWRESMGELSADERAALDVFLASRVGAPRLVEAKGMFHSLGCRGCHKIAGVGGDDGPDLTAAGQKDPALLDFSHVPGPRTVANWHAAHLRAPATVVAGSNMPQLGLTDAQIETLTFYLLSLRRSERPEAFWPRDRVRAERFGEREFATDGATLYGTFCAACHGPNGEGMRYPGMAAFPAIGNPDFLAVASDRFIADTVRHGRPGRRMPAWGEAEGGLRPAEIDAVVAHVRTFAPDVPAPDDAEPWRWARGDAAEGARLYAEACASCHGERGEGREGPALANPRLLASATDTYLVATIRRGRTGTAMPAFGSPSPTHRVLDDAEIESIVTFMRSWEDNP
ncbi:MAG TPA: c-type cytochrome [Candidatus Limnocylindria bacterium]|nr:c-type cytochrome [Candidatus Limnocylindria bacterium]